MKCLVSSVCFLSVLVFVSSAPFLPKGGSFSSSTSLQLGGSTGSTSSSGDGAGGLTNILSTIDLPGLLRGVNSFVKLVGAFCPPLSQVLDNVIQNVTSTAFRIFGRAILRNGGLGGSGGGSQSVNVVLPTFPPDDDEDDEDYEEDEDKENSQTSVDGSSSSSTFDADVYSRIGGSFNSSNEAESLTLKVDESTDKVDSDNRITTSSNNILSSDIKFSIGDRKDDNSDSQSSSNKESSESSANPTTLYTSPVNEESNVISKRHVRVTREAEDDQEGAESAPEPAEDLSDVEIDDQDRNKRYLPFGGSVSGEAHATGGSGNFLFDIIRLIAGSGATEESDEKANSPGGVVEVDLQKSQHYQSTEGVPGPITRLFVIANRGIANLVQDLILRLASTSEKLVNFKARLITSLI